MKKSLLASAAIVFGLSFAKPATAITPATPEPASAVGGATVILVCGPRCRDNRRVSRRTARRTSRRTTARRDCCYHGGYYDDNDNTAAVGIAAGIAGLAVGAAIASSANSSNVVVEDDYPN